ncbi:helix-turn-helix domain-containing protein [Rickettsiales bacterium]|jgi:transcriptional regulator with XRE-family HTH domain|nr:helix-turn-helix domain-containing protein [Rickettsiales bacterium]
MLLTTVKKAQEQIAINSRLQRLDMNLTQKGLAERSGVALATLRKFEQKGFISLEAFLKLQMVLGGLEKIVKSIEKNEIAFSSIDEVLKAEEKRERKRGKRK